MVKQPRQKGTLLCEINMRKLALAIIFLLLLIDLIFSSGTFTEQRVLLDSLVLILLGYGFVTSMGGVVEYNEGGF